MSGFVNDVIGSQPCYWLEAPNTAAVLTHTIHCKQNAFMWIDIFWRFRVSDFFKGKTHLWQIAILETEQGQTTQIIWLHKKVDILESCSENY